MASSDGEDKPFTPSKATGRAKTRHIIRWTDEKLILAFAEFRLAAQRHRIDIKKPMEDAAKSIGPYCTADALIQQLSKRRTRFIKESENPIPPPPPIGALGGTPGSRKKNAKKAGADSAANTPQTEVDTPSASVKKTPRSTRASNKKVKAEPGTDAASPGSEHSDSDYAESPLKTKKKRVRGGKKKAEPWDDDSDDDFVVDKDKMEEEDEEAQAPKETPKQATKATPSKPKQQPASTTPKPGQVEDVFVSGQGDQVVQPNFNFANDTNGNGFGGGFPTNFNNHFGQMPLMGFPSNMNMNTFNQNDPQMQQLFNQMMMAQMNSMNGGMNNGGMNGAMNGGGNGNGFNGNGLHAHGLPTPNNFMSQSFGNSMGTSGTNNPGTGNSSLQPSRSGTDSPRANGVKTTASTTQSAESSQSNNGATDSKVKSDQANGGWAGDGMDMFNSFDGTSGNRHSFNFDDTMSGRGSQTPSRDRLDFSMDDETM